jgi:hypothetical protein
MAAVSPAGGAHALTFVTRIGVIPGSTAQGTEASRRCEPCQARGMDPNDIGNNVLCHSGLAEYPG